MGKVIYQKRDHNPQKKGQYSIAVFDFSLKQQKDKDADSNSGNNHYRAVTQQVACKKSIRGISACRAAYPLGDIHTKHLS